jgi:hypothetical protein
MSEHDRILEALSMQRVLSAETNTLLRDLILSLGSDGSDKPANEVKRRGRPPKVAEPVAASVDDLIGDTAPVAPVVVAPAPVAEVVAPAPVAEVVAPAPVVVAPAPVVVAPTPVVVAPTPVAEVAVAPVVEVAIPATPPASQNVEPQQTPPASQNAEPQQIDDPANALRDLASKKGRDEALRVLGMFGVQKMGDITPARLGEFARECRKAIVQ